MTLLFGTIFRVLPDVVLRWRDVWLGALVTSVLFVLGRALIAVYLSTTATASTYGAAGSLAAADVGELLVADPAVRGGFHPRQRGSGRSAHRAKTDGSARHAQ